MTCIAERQYKLDLKSTGGGGTIVEIVDQIPPYKYDLFFCFVLAHPLFLESLKLGNLKAPAAVIFIIYYSL
jgi:hypothetical protein